MVEDYKRTGQTGVFGQRLCLKEVLRGSGASPLPPG